MEVLMRKAVALVLLSALACPAPALAAKPQLSWGKAGISFEQYRGDSIACASQGYYVDVSGTEAAQVFKRASRTIETNEMGGVDLNAAITTGRIVAGARPDERREEVRKLLQGTIDGCLIDRGYTPFELTQAQRKHLDQLKAGSQARHDYLYRLATDAEVLRSQAVSFVLDDAPIQAAARKH
jgi:hypothetical protein